jgi:predicted transcriptional regulator
MQWKIFKMKKPMAKRVPTKGIHVTTIRLDDATLAALDKHAAAAAEGPRARSWLIQKIIAEWLKAQSGKK